MESVAKKKKSYRLNLSLYVAICFTFICFFSDYRSGLTFLLFFIITCFKVYIVILCSQTFKKYISSPLCRGSSTKASYYIYFAYRYFLYRLNIRSPPQIRSNRSNRLFKQTIKYPVSCATFVFPNVLVFWKYLCLDSTTNIDSTTNHK